MLVMRRYRDEFGDIMYEKIVDGKGVCDMTERAGDNFIAHDPYFLVFGEIVDES